jgi:uncharacterized protein YigA (DUF484 family)
MSAGSPKRKEKPRITAADVESFLNRHPDFFEDRLDLLETLKVPHPCGDAVSLITRQVGVLRDKNRKLQQQLSEILHVVRDNETLRERMHRLNLALLNATGLEDALAALHWGLREYFQIDAVAVRVAQPTVQSPIADLTMPPALLEVFAHFLETGDPCCGHTDPEQGRYLFGWRNAELASCALIPLRHAGFRGLLAIGSRDPGRFQPDLGIAFLSQMGETVAARLACLILGWP